MEWIFFLIFLLLFTSILVNGILRKDKKTQNDSHDTSGDSGSVWWFLNDSDSHTDNHSGSSDSSGDGGGGGGD